MKSFIEKFEYLIFIASICVISAGVAGMYVKIFKMAPPVPTDVVQVPFLALMLVTIIVRIKDTIFGAVSILPYMLLMLLAIISFQWSLKPSFTLREGIISTVYVVYLATMAWRYSWKQLIEGMWTALFGMVVFSLLLYVAVPSIGKMAETHVGALSGVWIEKNSAGQAGVFGACLALARMAITPKKFMSSGISFVAFTLLLLLSTSKTSLVAYLVVCAGFGWVFMMRRGLPVAMLTLWTSLTVGGLLTVWVKNNTGEVLSLLGRSATFTGRAEIWEAVKISLANRPLLGHGYSGYWDEVVYGKTLAYVYDDLGFLPRHSHSSLIDIKLNLGLVGAVLLVGSIMFYLCVSLMKVRQSHGAYFAIPFTAAALVIGTFESVLANPANFAGGIIILVAAKMARPTLQSEMQSGFWAAVNAFRTEGAGPKRKRLIPAVTFFPVPNAAPQRPQLRDRRRPVQGTERRRGFQGGVQHRQVQAAPLRPSGPVERRRRAPLTSSEAIMWRLHNRRRNPFTYI